jgi:hypothetical protein
MHTVFARKSDKVLTGRSQLPVPSYSMNDPAPGPFAPAIRSSVPVDTHSQFNYRHR